ncbi:MAG: PAS domain-containing protein, partial [Elusimicrobiota bacterium]|nr:PAS domain-containing protein [Elusimicrobiota bacterium]
MKKREKMMNCWEYMKCEKKKCPAWGRRNSFCWLEASENYCDKIKNALGPVLDTNAHYRKIEICLDCPVFAENMNESCFSATCSMVKKRFSEYADEQEKLKKHLLKYNRELENKTEERTAELNLEIKKRQGQQEAMLNIMEDLDASNKLLKKEAAERKIIEAKINHRLEFERIIAVISARLAVSDDIKQAVYLALQDIGNFIGADRAYIFISEKKGRKLCKFCSWNAGGECMETGKAADFPASLFRKWLGKIKKGQIVNIKTFTGSPGVRGIGGKILKSQNIKSIILFPLNVKDNPAAFLGLDTILKESSWQRDDISILRIVSDILSKAIEQNELKEERKKYEFIVNTSLEMQTLINRNYIYESINKAFCEGMRRPRRDILGRSVPEIWGADIFDGTIKKYLDRCFAGEIVNYQDCFVLPGIADGFYDINMYPYFDGSGEVTHAVVITHDISDLKKMEEQMVRQSRLASIGKLAAGVAHELNNPLTAVTTYPDIIAASACGRLNKD